MVCFYYKTWNKKSQVKTLELGVKKNMREIPTMLTINQTAERVGLAKHFVRQLCLQNKICHVKAGNRYLINLERFIDYLNTGETANSSTASSGIRDLSK